jgi:hypothetical protein
MIVNQSGGSISPDKPVELVFEYFPAATDFSGFDFTRSDILSYLFVRNSMV